jgi:hypothetical protein
VTFQAQPRRPDLPPLAVVSSDTAGPIRQLSADGALHFGSLVDKATRFNIGKELPWKSDAAQFVHDGLMRLQRITGRTVGRYHSDGTREPIVPTLVTFLRAQGTETTTTAALTIQQPRSRRQEPSHLQREGYSADCERDLLPLLNIRCRGCRQQAKFHPSASAGLTVSPAHNRA